MRGITRVRSCELVGWKALETMRRRMRFEDPNGDQWTEVPMIRTHNGKELKRPRLDPRTELFVETASGLRNLCLRRETSRERRRRMGS